MIVLKQKQHKEYLLISGSDFFKKCFLKGLSGAIMPSSGASLVTSQQNKMYILHRIWFYILFGEKKNPKMCPDWVVETSDFDLDRAKWLCQLIKVIFFLQIWERFIFIFTACYFMQRRDLLEMLAPSPLLIQKDFLMINLCQYQTR